jgi:hypothetical protein
MVLELHDTGNLTESSMAELVGRYWKLAVITVEEDVRLGRIARSTVYDSPDERWRAAGIEFDQAEGA